MNTNGIFQVLLMHIRILNRVMYIPDSPRSKRALHFIFFIFFKGLKVILTNLMTWLLILTGRHKPNAATVDVFSAVDFKAP